MRLREAVSAKTAGRVNAFDGQYVTHADLLRIAKRNHCAGISTEPVLPLCRPAENFWVFKATVFKSAKCRGFVGYGDAHPGNVSPLIFNHAELRMAETRAVNRALRKAYGIALCSVEELPPWALSPQQVSILSRCPQPGTFSRKGVRHANESTRPQSAQRKKKSARRTLSRSRGSV
jgi:hypothetical protein